MKKILLLTIVLLVPMLASADAIEIDGIYYNLIPKGLVAEVTSNPNKYSGDIVIPSNFVYDGVNYSVKTINGSAFYECSGLTSIIIPNSVTTIGGSAFQGCGLTSVTIPNSVISIGKEAFEGCKFLKSVSIPSSLNSIDEDAFYGCNGLTSVYISDLTAWLRISFSSYESNPLVYASHLYLNNEEIIDLVIPNSVKYVDQYAFAGFKSLKSITIPNSVTTIGKSALSGCSGLTTLIIPNSVTSLGYNTFAYCIGLTSVTIPNSLTSISNYAFSGCI